MYIVYLYCIHYRIYIVKAGCQTRAEKKEGERELENGHCQKVDVAIAVFFRSRCQPRPPCHRFNLRHPFKCHEYTFRSVPSRRRTENTRRFPLFSTYLGR